MSLDSSLFAVLVPQHRRIELFKLQQDVFAGLLDPTQRKGQWVMGSVEAALYAPQRAADASDVFRLWAEHARTMIQACQRRGESDSVASWMYQHAALAPDMAAFPGEDS
jgi:hypothetical protein